MPAAPDIAHLRSRIAALEGAGPEALAGVVPLGVAAVDGALPWGGMPLGCLHEVAPRAYADGIEDGACLGFSAVLLGRLAASTDKPVLWVAAGDEPYGPALAALGLPPDRLMVVHGLRSAQLLWAVEEGLRCRALAGVLAESWKLDFTAARRLQLAARTSGVPAVMLNHGEPTGTSVTRWRVGTAPSRSDPALGVGSWCWRLELMRCRGLGAGEDGVVGAWDVEWDDETRGLRLAAPAGDRTAAPERFRAAG
jgi:protein ImuA